LKNEATAKEQTVEESNAMVIARRTITKGQSNPGENQLEKAQKDIGAKML